MNPSRYSCGSRFLAVAILDQHDKKWLWKFILRVSTILLAAAGIGCIAWALSSTSRQVVYYEYANSYGTPLVFWGLIPLALSILWNAGNIAVLLSLNQPLHPGAIVGCDLGLWIFLLATGVMLTIFAADDISDDGHDNISDYYYPSGPYLAPSYYKYGKPYRRQGIIEAVGSALTFIVMLCHFALFVSACRYTNERRRSRVQTQAAIIAREMVFEMTNNRPSAPAQQPVAVGQLGDPAQPAQQQSAPTSREPQPQPHQTQQNYPTSDTQTPVFPKETQAPTSWILPHQYSPSEAFVSAPIHQHVPGNNPNPPKTPKTRNVTPDAAASLVPQVSSWTSPPVSPQSPTLGRYDHLSRNFEVSQSIGKG